MPKRVLVTGAGGSGFIGSHMIDFLSAQGDFEIVATDLQKGQYFNSAASFVPSDLTKPESLLAVFDRGPFDFVFHIAAVFNYSASLETLCRVNVEGTRNLLEAVKKFSPEAVTIVWGSGSVYGKTGNNAATEQSPTTPKNNYERSKLLQEKLALELAHSQGLKVAVIRPAAVYGPRSKYGAAVPLLMIARGEIPFIIGKGSFQVSFVHVDDVVGSAYFLASNYDQLGYWLGPHFGPERFVFNVNDDSQYTLEDLFKHVEHCLRDLGRSDVRLWPIHYPIWALKPLLWWNKFSSKHFGTPLKLEEDLIGYLAEPFMMSNAKLKRVGYRLRRPDAKAGLKETVEWYRKEGVV